MSLNVLNRNDMTPEIKQKLFNYFVDNHDVMLLDGDFNEIEEILNPRQFPETVWPENRNGNTEKTRVKQHGLECCSCGGGNISLVNTKDGRVVWLSFECDDCGHGWTTTDLDTMNLEINRI